MKILALLFLTLSLSNNCQGQKDSDLEMAKIEYTANSRGLYQNIVIENKILSQIDSRGGKAKKSALTNSQYKALAKDFQAVTLEEIPSLKAPSQKRLHDGAAMAHLKLTYRGKTYESQTFDHGYPPEKIKNLVNRIRSLSKKEE